MQRTLLRGANLLEGSDMAFDGQPRDVLVRDGRIQAIEPAGTVGADHYDALIPLEHRLLAPGLINGHQHSHEHFQRGRTENLPLELWQHMVRGRSPVKLTPRQAYLRTMIGAVEALRTGCTTLVDDLALGAGVDRDVVDSVLQAYDDCGVRALLGFAMMDKPMVDNFPFVDELLPAELLADLRQAPRPSAEDFTRLMRELAGARHPHERRVGVLVSASAPQRCTQRFLLDVRALADEYALPVITHVQETRLQVITGLQFYGTPIVEYLARIGFLKPATSLVHAVWLNPREMALMAEHGATAQHNPWSNLLLGSGVQPVRELLEAGVNVSLGSDGGCSTVTTNMLQVVGAAAGLAKLRGADGERWISAREAWQAGTVGGARALGFGDGLGVLTPGARADLVGYRLDSVTFTPLNDPLRQLAYAERGAGIDFSMVDGEVTMRAGRLTRIDEAALLAEIAETFNGLREQYTAAEANAAPVIAAMEAVYRRSLQLAVPPDTFPARLDALNPSAA
ncbi:amidohydrolase family protein [Verticiella sediminum]|uniref:Amidohydrolase family protein n=1 Tax=Verticiella sediminum TaxID=1247510 RepID=A0A556ARI3_9BURK|nr:amidohydrolase family protein [Verticiella sediminum]TSH95552.1 amidohydrolase family protein [Verticiella sediminum]